MEEGEDDVDDVIFEPLNDALLEVGVRERLEKRVERS
jgi:hypothetical protein